MASSGLSKAIHAIGWFYDYYYLIEGGRPIDADELGGVLARFMEAREFGTSILGWDAVRKKTAIDDVRYVSAFTEFCADEFGHQPINRRETKFATDLNVREQRRFFAALSHRKDWDNLAHLVPSTQAGKGIVSRPAFDPKEKRRTKASYDRKSFPPAKVLALIATTPSTRDKLYLLLLFFGSLRASEPLHLFVTDVTISSDGTAKVILGHPRTGAYEWADSLRGRQTGNRATFLKERYFLGPRHKLGAKHPLHAGWKGMAFDSASRNEAEVTWLVPEMGRYFARLHIEYMHATRRHVRDEHPYYFVNEKDGAQFGKPAKLSNMTKAFYRAARRIGLSPSDEGVNPHGARHFYGYFCASQLRISLDLTQMMMHHTSILSTKTYYDLDKAVGRDELQKGQARIARELPSFCADAARLLTSG
ncbi:hypothetical protein AYM40_02210 [Paraburkholderia phytofirmans OLGA172]|uniref:Tyr recombinase domain-containing protein n=1 Tax=Paraburkholderia phytofirmans OLGA172 TaxID=1417228 RepID=A0A160FGU3_9BURK|nr:site-specific integrase [Paraburkholderia phytofirmans]ANB71312.1 hypothetical protein AYM40_02210 [Paraburkholderia phytofirmans OLGA172]